MYFQCLVRKFLASRYVQKLKMHKEKELQEQIRRIQDQAAGKIQSLIRRYLARCEYERTRKQIQDQAAIKIQSLVRRYLARCEYERMRQEKLDNVPYMDEEEPFLIIGMGEEEAAIKIQVQYS